jgi:hypothetical protein
MEYVFFWLVLSIVAGVIASNKGRSGFGYFVLSIFLSPLIGIILVACLSTVEKGVRVDGEIATADTHVRCPDCRELVRKDARVCKHCRCKLVPVEEPPAASEKIGSAIGRFFSPPPPPKGK